MLEKSGFKNIMHLSRAGAMFACIFLSCTISLISCENDSTTVEENTGNISGTVTYSNLDKESNAGIYVSLDRTDGLRTLVAVNNTKVCSLNESRSLAGSTSTNSDGSYVFANLEPGVYTVYASSPYSSKKAVCTNVVVHAAETTIADSLNLVATGSISGRLTIDNEEFGNEGFLVAVAGTSYMAMTAPDGSFTISDVPAGSGYVLYATKKAETFLVKADVTVTADDTVILDAVNFSSEDIKPAKGDKGDAGQNGKDGVSLNWLGTLDTVPENAEYLDAYFNESDGCTYIYNGEKWTLLAKSGESKVHNARVVILYELNGGALPENAPLVYTYGNPIKLEEPALESYNFLGFYYNSDFSGEKVTSLDDDYAYGKVLYAKWGYRITFDDNYTGGALNTLEYYDIDSVNNNFNTPVRTGYKFLGWYNNPNYDEQIDSWNTSENKGNVTLYAKWKINEYTITYVTLYGDCPEPVKVEYNTVLDETYFPVLSDWDYFCFNGWKANGVPVGPNYVVTNSTKFYADYILKEGFRFSDCLFQDNSHFNGTVSTRLDLDYLAYKYELPSVKIYLDSFYFGSGTVYFDSPSIGSHPCPEAKDWYDQFYYELEHYLNGYTYGRDNYRNSFIFESGVTCHPCSCSALDIFEAGNYKCYAIASLQGHKYLVPISYDEKLILIDEESVDPDSIPEGYYYDVTIP